MRAVASRRKILIGGALAVLLLVANGIVAVRYLGTRAGQTYCWICRESGAELTATPSKFGAAHLKPGRANSGRPNSWELIEPRPLSVFLPWNWLALALDGGGPDPQKIVRDLAGR
jgi:hypothetical protein